MCLEGECVADRQWALWPVPELPLSPDNYEIQDRIVTDLTTNLTWERHIAAGSWSYDHAAEYCENLELEGGGWRVPTRIELISIVDYSRVRPAVEPTVFPETPPVELWHQPWRRRPTPSGSCPNSSVCQLHFAEGTRAYFGPSGDQPHRGRLQTHIRCVRGGPLPAPMEEHYEVTDETVLDTQTQLMWQREASRPIPSGGFLPEDAVNGLEEAEAFCRDSTTGRFGDWRVPTISELQTLFVPYPNVNPLDEELFPRDSNTVETGGSYTSSTLWAGSDDEEIAWRATFTFSPPDIRHGAASRVRCVRDAGQG